MCNIFIPIPLACGFNIYIQYSLVNSAAECTRPFNAHHANKLIYHTMHTHIMYNNPLLRLTDLHKHKLLKLYTNRNSGEMGQSFVNSQYMYTISYMAAFTLYIDTTECLENINVCDQICINTTESFQCHCLEGYILSSNESSCLDVDECTAGTHNCQQHHVCTNINGGFVCDCGMDNQLSSDGRTCTCKYGYTS